MANVTLACQFCGKLNRLDPARYQDRPKCAECQKPFLIDRPVKVKEEHFDQTVLESEVPVLVDFYADWCGPCVMMQPLLDKVATELAGKALVVKVNTDHSPKVSERYGIRGIPFFARFEHGEMAGSATGAQSFEALKHLASGA